MSLIIDGYNLLHAAGILGQGRGPGGLERSRNALLNFLAESVAPDEVARTIVVFDAREAPYGLSRKFAHRGLTVYFASKYPDADSLIEELIEEDSAPKRLTVVSSDHRLHRAARRRKAKPVDSDLWFFEIVRRREARRREKPAGDAKPAGPLSPGEVDYWLHEFSGGALGDEQRAVTETAAPGPPAREKKAPPETEPQQAFENPFPPGYADDIFDEEG